VGYYPNDALSLTVINPTLKSADVLFNGVDVTEDCTDLTSSTLVAVLLTQHGQLGLKAYPSLVSINSWISFVDLFTIGPYIRH
jgi:hypothetical protein